MSELGDFLDDINDLCRERLEVFGSCQGRTKTGKRCHNRAIVRHDGIAFCAKHRPATEQEAA